MPIYTNDPYDDGFFPAEPSLRSSIGIGPKVTKAIDAATKDWLDKHPEATTTVEDNSLTNAKLKDGSVNSRVIEDESIITDDIADLAVTTPKIADNAVTADKIASSAADGLRIMSTTQPGVAKVGAGLAMNGQALELDGNGDIATAVTSWLNAHPEATTTVQDGAVTDAKLVQSGGVLSEVHDIRTGADGTIYASAGEAVRKQVSNISGTTDNLIDLNKMTASGITIDGNMLRGTAAAFYTAFYNGIPIDATFEAGSKYLLSAKARNTGEVASSNGIVFGIHYTDGTATTVGVANDKTDFWQLNVMADTTKTVEYIYMSYNAIGANVWEITDLTLEKVRATPAYIPHVTGVDYQARNDLAIMQISEQSHNVIDAIVSDIVNDYSMLDAYFELGNILLGDYSLYDNSTSRARTKQGVPFHLKAGTRIFFPNGEFYIQYVENDVVHRNGWITSYLAPIDADYEILLRYTPETTITDLSAFLADVEILPPRDEAARGIKNNIGQALNKFGRFYDHMLLNKINGSNVIIPLQSLPSISMSKRLGFKVIEANVRRTSDDKYIVTHGTDGAFGSMFEHVDGTTDISGISIASVTLSWIQENVRYKSLYGKYRTAPPTLEEYLATCKELGMIPMLQVANDVNIAAIGNKIMGKDNYIAYDSTRELNSGYIINTYYDRVSKEEVVNECEKYGHPFIYSIPNPSIYSDDELADIVEAVHEKGYMLGYQDTYISEPVADKYRNMGFDFCATTWNINDIECGNLWNVSGDISFNDFETMGTINTDGNLILTNGQYVRKWGSPQRFLVGVVAYVRFSGILTVNMSGNFRSGTYTSDGSEYVRISAGALQGYSEFMLTSTGDTIVYELIAKASNL